jgi:hypothetical protein
MDEVNIMIRVKMLLEQLPDNEQSIEYQHIVQCIQTFLFNNCKHSYITDYIDVTPDRSKQIVYCQHCLLSPTDT